MKSLLWGASHLVIPFGDEYFILWLWLTSLLRCSSQQEHLTGDTPLVTSISLTHKPIVGASHLVTPHCWHFNIQYGRMYYASPQCSISVRLAYQTLKADWWTLPGRACPTLANSQSCTRSNSWNTELARVQLNSTQLNSAATLVYSNHIAGSHILRSRKWRI